MIKNNIISDTEIKQEEEEESKAEDDDVSSQNEIPLENEEIMINSSSRNDGVIFQPIVRCFRLIVCHRCNETFKTNSQLQKHQRIQHQEKKPLLQCSHCDKKFKYKSGLKVHERLHTGEKPYSCNQCDKKFIQTGDLKRHQRVHTGEKTFACT